MNIFRPPPISTRPAKSRGTPERLSVWAECLHAASNAAVVIITPRGWTDLADEARRWTYGSAPADEEAYRVSAGHEEIAAAPNGDERGQARET